MQQFCSNCVLCIRQTYHDILLSFLGGSEFNMDINNADALILGWLDVILLKRLFLLNNPNLPPDFALFRVISFNVSVMCLEIGDT